MIVGLTGHRPPDLGGYGEDAFRLLVDIIKEQYARIMPEEVISGMALGFDQAGATAAWELGIPYAAYIPFEEQAKAWPKESRYRWQTLRENASRERVFGKDYKLEYMQARNKGIIDDCEIVLAGYNGYPYSGTAHAIGLAKEKHLQIINVYSDWQRRFKDAGLQEKA